MNRRGQITEYGILVSLVVLILLVALYTLSVAVSDMWMGIAAGFAGGST